MKEFWVEFGKRLAIEFAIASAIGAGAMVGVTLTAKAIGCSFPDVQSEGEISD